MDCFDCVRIVGKSEVGHAERPKDTWREIAIPQAIVAESFVTTYCRPNSSELHDGQCQSPFSRTTR